MMKFKQITYFGDLPKNAFIYEIAQFNGYIYLYKHKIVDKTVESHRDKGRFGGSKISKVTLKLSTVEYQNKPYNTEFQQEMTVVLDANRFADTYQGHIYYSDFHELVILLNMYKRDMMCSMKLIDEFVVKNEIVHHIQQKRQINEYVKEHGSIDGIKGIDFAKPL